MINFNYLLNHYNSSGIGIKVLRLYGNEGNITSLEKIKNFAIILKFPIFRTSKNSRKFSWNENWDDVFGNYAFKFIRHNPTSRNYNHMIDIMALWKKSNKSSE